MKNKYALYVKSCLLILSFISGFIYIPAQSQNNFLIGIWSSPDIAANFVAAPADYDGDGKTDISVKTSGGYWLIDYAFNGFHGWEFGGNYPPLFSQYGGLEAIPVPGDYDHDGHIDLAVKTNSGVWLIDYYAINGLGSWDVTLPFNYGDEHFHPVPADYDGDGYTDIAAKTDDGRWLIDYYAKNGGFNGWDDVLTQYGGIEAHPVPADYNGDGAVDIAVKTDDGHWFIDYYQKNIGFNGWDYALTPAAIYGGETSIPAPADYNGDGKADIAVQDQGIWKIDYADAAGHFGTWDRELGGYGDIKTQPLPADYNGDKYADLSLKMNENGTWLVDYAEVTGGQINYSGWDEHAYLGQWNWPNSNYTYLIGPSAPYYNNDLVKFQKIKNANIDFIIDPEMMFSPENYARIYTYLDLAKKSSLKVLLSGNDIAKKLDPDPLTGYKQEFLDAFKNHLPTGLDQAIMGIFLGDEPQIGDLNNVKKWTNFFNTNYTQQPTFYNLFPRYGPFADDASYESYLDKYINENSTSFVSYDHYPFENNMPFRTDYFYNMRVFKEKLGYNRPFWFVIQSNKDYAPEPYEPKLRFLTSSAIAYGAKGLLYWSYINGFEENAANYASIQKVNKYIKEVVGPVVLTADYITALHKSDTYMNQGRPFDSSELVDLNSTGVIRDVSNNNILLALYQKADVSSTDYYIWIMNKDVSTTATSTKINLEGAYLSSSISPRVDTYISPNNGFVTINRTLNHVTNITTITIPELKPGEGVMLKVKQSLLNKSNCDVNTENLMTLN
ncbi:hypothetical protein CEY12_11665 [Chryseobacterium sp. T16E-39]|uniref:FG-GAP repeat domain-containing protein n=1 Tax=Chryseobacterium sp. T16E-39 TaxID=2015076 RepID=UPI000B5B1BBB|nr:VCBS repeat-containing protein [Chryseobacterium sp. T16E-39]ASK30733.1 hypothetical protein CEY12_11665 [Chryseobacterium sp. T16E-39]